MLRRLRSLLAGCLLFASPSSSSSTTIVVPDDVPQIQTAIDQLPDTVLVRSGSYSERPVVMKDLVLVGVGPTLPVVDGFQIFIREQQTQIIVDGLHFKGPARLTTLDETTELFAFRRCVFDSGFTQERSDIYDALNLEFRDCQVVGAFSAYATNFFTFVGNTVEGPVRLQGDHFVHLDVSDNVIRSVFSPPSQLGLWIDSDQTEGVIRRNHVRGFWNGVIVSGAHQVEISDNCIVDCAQVGLSVLSDIAVIEGNTILRCDIGMTFLGDDIEVRGNVIGHSNFAGIEASFQSRTRLANNTLYLNGGSGIATKFADVGAVVDIDHNIAYGNAGYGAEGVPLDSKLSCNDWFGNSHGAVSPVGPGETDLAVDPQFCSVADDSVHLQRSSPLIDAPGCGVVGAHGAGCDQSTAVEVALFTVEASDDGVVIRWQLDGDTPTEPVWIERSESGGAWQRIPTRHSHEGSVQVDHDDTAEPARTYAYRLVWFTSRGTTAWSSAVNVTTEPAVVQFQLDAVAPQPSSEEVQIRFSLPRDGAIQLVVLDVQGRVIARLANGRHHAGVHTIRWSGQGVSGAAPPGLYLVRYVHPDGQQSRSLLRVR